MNAQSLLNVLTQSGAIVTAHQGKLLIDALAPLPEALLSELAAHKAELVAAIQRLPAPANNDDGEAIPDFDEAINVRRRKVLAMLADNPGVRHAVAVDDPDTDPVILALAIRGKGTCELLIPKANYDPFKIVAMIQANFGGVTWH